MKAFLLFTLSLSVFLTCNSQENGVVSKQDKSEPGNGSADSEKLRVKPSRHQITLAYSTAILEYLKATYSKDKSNPDTLFIGKRPDFPDIELPEIILNSRICLIELDEVYKMHDRENYAFLNVMDWFSGYDPEFILVRFNRGSKPQHNCIIDLKYNDKSKEFDLISLRFEDPYSKADRRTH